MPKLVIRALVVVVIIGLSVSLGFSLGGVFSRGSTQYYIPGESHYKFDYANPFSRFLPYQPVGCTDEVLVVAQQFSVVLLAKEEDPLSWFAQGIRFGRYVVTVGHAYSEEVKPEAVRIFEDGAWATYPIRRVWQELDPGYVLIREILDAERSKDAALFIVTLPNKQGSLPDSTIVPTIVSPDTIPEGSPLCGMLPSGYFGDITFLYEGWLSRHEYPWKPSFSFFITSTTRNGMSGSPVIASTYKGAAIIGMTFIKQIPGDGWFGEDRPAMNYNAVAHDLLWLLAHIKQATGIDLLNQ